MPDSSTATVGNTQWVAVGDLNDTPYTEMSLLYLPGSPVDEMWTDDHGSTIETATSCSPPAPLRRAEGYSLMSTRSTWPLSSSRSGATDEPAARELLARAVV